MPCAGAHRAAELISSRVADGTASSLAEAAQRCCGQAHALAGDHAAAVQVRSMVEVVEAMQQDMGTPHRMTGLWVAVYSA